MAISRVCIIPARSGSKRLKDKNIFKLHGKPLLVWSYLAAKESNLFKKIYVSTESENYISICKKNNIDFIKRPISISNDSALKQEVIVHAKEYLSLRGEIYDQYMSLQANSPDVTPNDLRRIVTRFEKFNRWEVVTVDKNLNQNGIARIMRNNVVDMKSLSAVIGVEVVERSNIHTIDDIRELEKVWNPNS